MRADLDHLGKDIAKFLSRWTTGKKLTD